jgi:hypothetical protein
MKETAGYAPAVKCGGCRLSDDPQRDCPPGQRDDTCLVWAAFAHPDAGGEAAREGKYLPSFLQRTPLGSMLN